VLNTLMRARALDSFSYQGVYCIHTLYVYGDFQLVSCLAFIAEFDCVFRQQWRAMQLQVWRQFSLKKSSLNRLTKFFAALMYRKTSEPLHNVEWL